MNVAVNLLLVFSNLFLLGHSSHLPPLPVNPGGIGGLFRGPNSETIIRGPDGSQITSEQIGGQVQTEVKLDPIIVPDYEPDPPEILPPAAPVLIPHSASAQVQVPLTAPVQVPLAAPVEIQSQSFVPIASAHEEIPISVGSLSGTEVDLDHVKEDHVIETEFVDAPEVEPEQSSDLKGPSGSISVRGSSSIVSGPASTTISEPIRKIPLVPVAAPVHSVPVAPVSPALHLLPPVPQTPLISLQDTSGAGIADAASTGPIRTDLVHQPTLLLTPNQPQHAGIQSVNIPIVSSTQRPILSNPIPVHSSLQPPLASLHPSSLRPAIVSTTARPIISSSTPLVPSSSIAQTSHGVLSTSQLDLPVGVNLENVQSGISSTTSVYPQGEEIEVSRINLGASPTSHQLNLDIPSGVTLQDVVTSTTPANLLSDGIDVNQINLGVSSTLAPPTVQQSNLNGISSIQNYEGYTAIDQRDIISPSVRSKVIDTKRHWLNIEPVAGISTNNQVLAENNNANLEPIASVLDTVLVQPTDPQNREIIEWQGKQLENVGNIVPVLRNPVLISGNLNGLQEIPTASVSQLTARNELDASIYGRYGRDTNAKKDDSQK